MSENELSVLHVITGLEDGGAEGVLYRLCGNRSISRQCVVSMMGEGKYGPLLRKLGIDVVCLNMPQGRVTLKGLLQLWRVLRIARPDVVQTWMYHSDLIGGVLARLAGVKRIFWNIRHTTLDVKHSKQSTILVAKLCAVLSKWIPTGVVCCAQRALEIHRNLGYKASMYVIPNGYDLNNFSSNDSARARLRDSWGVGDNWLVGMVGRFDPQKDHKNFLAALKGIRCRGINALAVLVGRGLNEGNEQIESWINEFELQDYVRLLGQREDVPNIMNALDIHVLSSAFGEAFPNVVAEAMACGTPVISTDVGDAAAIIGETGWVVLPRNTPALVEALLVAAEERHDVITRAARSAAARKRVEENFSLSRMVASYEMMWQSGKL